MTIKHRTKRTRHGQDKTNAAAKSSKAAPDDSGSDQQSRNEEFPSPEASEMKLAEFWARYDEYTRDLTEHGRKLAFAAAAICWFFKTGNFTFPPLILWSLTFIVGFFMADVTQYLTGALTTKRFARDEEEKAWKEKGSIDIDIKVPEKLDRPVFRLFILKLCFLMTSFVFLIAEFLRRLF